MTQYGFHFDGTRCTGCKTCMLACKDKNDLSNEIAFRKVYEYGGGAWMPAAGGAWTTDTFTYHVSGACNHCDKPACMANCSQGAISKDAKTGIVMIDAEKCNACGACVESCPYAEPRIDAEKNVAVKCDMCAERVEAGSVPVCVEACPLRALDFGEIEDLRSKYGGVATVAPLPDAAETQPNIVITEPRNSKPVGDTTGALANAREVA